MDAYAALHLNATPVFADVDEDTFLITAKTIKPKITKKTKAIIVVSLQGLPVDIDPILKIARPWSAKELLEAATHKMTFNGAMDDI